MSLRTRNRQNKPVFKHTLQQQKKFTFLHFFRWHNVIFQLCPERSYAKLYARPRQREIHVKARENVHIHENTKENGLEFFDYLLESQVLCQRILNDFSSVFIFLIYFLPFLQISNINIYKYKKNKPLFQRIGKVYVLWIFPLSRFIFVRVYLPTGEGEPCPLLGHSSDSTHLSRICTPTSGTLTRD